MSRESFNILKSISNVCQSMKGAVNNTSYDQIIDNGPSQLEVSSAVLKFGLV